MTPWPTDEGGERREWLAWDGHREEVEAFVSTVEDRRLRMGRIINGRDVEVHPLLTGSAQGRIGRDGTLALRRYRKVAPVVAGELDEHVVVDTPEGTMTAEPGDFLVTDDPPTHAWPVKRDVFLATYREIPKDGATRELLDTVIDGDPNVDCERAPVGWYCTRGNGHNGPCAAWPERVVDPTLVRRSTDTGWRGDDNELLPHQVAVLATVERIVPTEDVEDGPQNAAAIDRLVAETFATERIADDNGDELEHGADDDHGDVSTLSDAFLGIVRSYGDVVPTQRAKWNPLDLDSFVEGGLLAQANTALWPFGVALGVKRAPGGKPEHTELTVLYVEPWEVIASADDPILLGRAKGLEDWMRTRIAVFDEEVLAEAPTTETLAQAIGAIEVVVAGVPVQVLPVAGETVGEFAQRALVGSGHWAARRGIADWEVRDHTGVTVPHHDAIEAAPAGRLWLSPRAGVGG